jgi:predicted lipoprotein with Yx(FWY)xxD motif
MKTAAAILAVSLALAGCGSDYGGDGSSDSESGAPKITTAKAGDQTVLVDANGMTLYALGAEKEKGRFLCIEAKCLSTWRPVPGQAEGVEGLTTVARPDRSHQAAYKGLPLYTFSGDKAKGDTNGEGVRDVGVWHAVAVAGKPAESSGGGGGGYGGY